MSDNATRFVVTMTATGEVRDKDGVLLSSTPVESELLLTTEEINALLEGQDR